MAGDDLYTNDGTLDINKNPANREKTGKWKACRFILGMVLTFLRMFSVDTNRNGKRSLFYG